MFLSAFVAATLIPAGSEVALLALFAAGDRSVAALLLVASTGNVLGSCVSYALGRVATRFADRPWFPASPAALARAETRYRRWGRWSLLLSWVPIIGDPITVAAGLMREPVWSFVALVAIAKTGRYVAVLAALGG
nr:YqaA family protein [Jannaschia sp. S6380]